MTRRIRGQPKVLVVDDEPDLLELLELTLSRMGLDTSRAETVAEAIRLLDKTEAGQRPIRLLGVSAHNFDRDQPTEEGDCPRLPFD